MGRKRNSNDAWMPPRVYRGRTSFEYHPKEGGSIQLCPRDSKKSVVWQEYEKHADTGILTFQRMFEKFKISPQYNEVSERTQKDYEQYNKYIKPVFGATRPDKITTPHIRIYMDKRGVKAPVRANKELSFMSKIFNWGKERAYCKSNPCIGIKRYKTKDRTRYITHAEYKIVYEAASIPVKVAMDISYLCAARQQDVLSLTWAQIDDKGIYIKQGKTGKEQIKLWSQALRDAVQLSKTQPGPKSIKHVIHNKQGKKYTSDGFRSMWSLAYNAAFGDDKPKDRFTFHDIKAKGVSDYEQGDKQLFSGHKTRRQVDVYDRKVQEVDALDPSKNK